MLLAFPLIYSPFLIAAVVVVVVVVAAAAAVVVVAAFAVAAAFAARLGQPEAAPVVAPSVGALEPQRQPRARDYCASCDLAHCHHYR